MASGLAIIPILTSNLTFCTRRTGSSLDSFDSGNAAAGTTSACVATGQLRNAFNFTTNIAKQSKNALAADFVSAEENLKTMGQKSGLIKNFGKLAKLAGENINTIIWLGAGANIITSDNKTDALIDEGFAIPMMFGAEAIGKRAFGLPYTQNFDPKTMIEKNGGLYSIKDGKEQLLAISGRYKFIDDGKKVVIEREGWLSKSPMLKKQAEAINDFCATRKFLGKSLKWLPKVGVGAAFVCSSILGYKTGKATANVVKDFVHGEAA